jgi:hypothetical protein
MKCFEHFSAVAGGGDGGSRGNDAAAGKWKRGAAVVALHQLVSAVLQGLVESAESTKQ